MGREFGATTGRARRCGWFDAVATRYAAMINGIDDLAVTNLDGLDDLDVIRVCTAYTCGGSTLELPPSDSRRLESCKPVYIEMPGWKTSTEGVKRFDDLPANAKAYLHKIAGLTGASLRIVSVGAHRDQTIVL